MVLAYQYYIVVIYDIFSNTILDYFYACTVILFTIVSANSLVPNEQEGLPSAADLQAMVAQDDVEFEGVEDAPHPTDVMPVDTIRAIHDTPHPTDVMPVDTPQAIHDTPHPTDVMPVDTPQAIHDTPHPTDFIPPDDSYPMQTEPTSEAAFSGGFNVMTHI